MPRKSTRFVLWSTLLAYLLPSQAAMAANKAPQIAARLFVSSCLRHPTNPERAAQVWRRAGFQRVSKEQLARQGMSTAIFDPLFSKRRNTARYFMRRLPAGGILAGRAETERLRDGKREYHCAILLSGRHGIGEARAVLRPVLGRPFRQGRDFTQWIRNLAGEPFLITLRASGRVAGPFRLSLNNDRDVIDILRE